MKKIENILALRSNYPRRQVHRHSLSQPHEQQEGCVPGTRRLDCFPPERPHRAWGGTFGSGAIEAHSPGYRRENRHEQGQEPARGE